MKKFLISGFGPFGGESINPTEQIITSLPDVLFGVQLTKRILPISFEHCADELILELSSGDYDAVIMLGQAAGRAAITPEAIAVNIIHARIPDNDGLALQYAHVCDEAPAAYYSTLPVKTIVNAIGDAGVPCAMSASAGSFVCNTIMFKILHYLCKENKKIPAGFIHVPCLPEQVLNRDGVASMALEKMVHGISVAIKITSEGL